MDSYTSFAQVYDLFMDNVDYPAWCEYIKSLLKEYGINDGLVLDLGCGTGTVTELLLLLIGILLALHLPA